MRRARRKPAAQGVRAMRAAGIVLAIVAVAVAVDVAAKGAVAVEGPSALAEIMEALSEGDPGSGGEPSNDPAFAETFERELFPLAGERDVRVANEGKTVGFLKDGSAASAFETVASRLEASGWTRVPSGSATCGSFLKEGGDARWAFVSCIGFGDEASVVVQCA